MFYGAAIIVQEFGTNFGGGGAFDFAPACLAHVWETYNVPYMIDSRKLLQHSK